MFVGQPAEAEGQAVEGRAEQGGQAVGDPFRDEVDAAFAPVADVGADIEERVAADGAAQGRGEAPADRRPQVLLREGDEGDVGMALIKVQFEGDVGLEDLRVDAVVDENRVGPVGAEHRAEGRAIGGGRLLPPHRQLAGTATGRAASALAVRCVCYFCYHRYTLLIPAPAASAPAR